jgi:protochlorophyllide reductase
MASRDLAKARLAAHALGLSPDQSEIAMLNLGSLASARRFADSFIQSGRSLNAVVCSEGVYLPLLKQPQRSEDGYEISVATNYPGHFLLANLLLDHLSQTPGARLVCLGAVTASSEEFGGKIPIPAPADLGDFEGLAAGFKSQVAMIDGKTLKAGSFA